MSKSKSLWVIFAIIALFISVYAAESPQKLDFYYEFRPDATYKMTAEIENEITMEFKGEELDEEALMLQQMQNLKQTMGIDMEQKFGEPDKEGHLSFEANIVDYRTKMFSGGMEISMPPETVKMIKDMMMQMKWNGKMTRKGKIVDLNVSGIEKIPGFSKEDIKKIYSIYPEFPEKKLKVGDDFTYSIIEPFEFGQGEQAIKAEIDITYHYHLKEIKEGTAYFDVKTDFQMAGVSGKSESMEIKGSGKGYSVYDIERHFFMNISQDGDFTVIASRTAEKKSEGEEKESEPFQMIMKVKSIVNMTMTIFE